METHRELPKGLAQPDESCTVKKPIPEGRRVAGLRLFSGLAVQKYPMFVRNPARKTVAPIRLSRPSGRRIWRRSTAQGGPAAQIGAQAATMRIPAPLHHP